MHRDIDMSIKMAIDNEAEAAEKLRDLELMRLDKALTAIWQAVLRGSHWHVLRLIQISEIRMKLYGWERAAQEAPEVESSPVESLMAAGMSTTGEQEWDEETMAAFIEILRDAKIVEDEQAEYALNAAVGAGLISEEVIADDDVVDVEVISEDAEAAEATDTDSPA